jgi:hypothetical protein
MEASPLTPPRDPFQVLDNDVILQATRKSVEKGAQLQGGGGGGGGVVSKIAFVSLLMLIWLHSGFSL